MSIKLDKYMPLYAYLSPASIPQIVAHIQDYLVKHPILSVETIAEIIVQSLQEHPELINGEAIPISADSAQSIKAYIDALPALDTYTKAEINALLLGKQDTLTFDQAPTPGSSNPVTSSGIIAAMSALQSALETQISAKADRASTYTKTQVDTLLEDKADADNVYSKNTMDAKLLEINTDIDNLEDDLSDQSQQIAEEASRLDSNQTETTDVLALAQACTKTTFFKMSGSAAYTGDLPSNAYKGSTGIINVRGGGRFVIITNPYGGIATNYYDGTSWSGWQFGDITPINNLTSNSTTAALSAAMGKELKDEKAIGFDPVFESGVTFSSAYKYVYKYHNMVIINGIITLDSYTANYIKTVAILPAAVRPNSNYIDVVCWCDDSKGLNTSLGRLLINIDGRMQVYSNTSNIRYSIHAVYTTA